MRPRRWSTLDKWSKMAAVGMLVICTASFWFAAELVVLDNVPLWVPLFFTQLGVNYMMYGLIFSNSDAIQAQGGTQ